MFPSLFRRLKRPQEVRKIETDFAKRRKMARRPSESSEVVSCEGWRAKGLVLHFKQVEALGRCSGRGGGAGAGVENLFQIDGGESTLAYLDEGSDQIPNHPIKKAVPLKGQLQNTALFFDDPNGTNIANGGFSFVSRVGGERSEVVFPSQDLGGFAQRREVKRAGNVPSPTDFERVKRIGVGDSV